jgi:hypothetical protein
MIRSALLAMGLVAAAASTAAAQGYYPYVNSYSDPYYFAGSPYYGYSGPVYPPYSYPYASPFGYPWGNGYSSYYGWPYSGSYPAPAYRPGLAYSDPYVYARPYSDSAGPAASDRVGY